MNLSRDYAKFLSVVSQIKNCDLIGKEFTKKEFDKIFKGTKKNPSDISLDWLRYNGARDGRVTYNRYGNKKVTPFVKVVREETFEMPLSENSLDYGKKIKAVRKIGSGEIVNCNIDMFEKDEFYRDAVIAKMGDCAIVETEKTTFMAKKYFYMIDIDAINSINIERYTMLCREIYEDKLAKARKEVARLEKVLANF